MDQQQTPILSICIPTFNRASFLKVMLAAVVRQAAEFSSEIEIVVSDNASSDNTREIVDGVKNLGPVVYSRNDENLGVIHNMVRVSTEIAKGDYVWLLGDSHIVAPGAIGHLLSSIKRHPDLKIFYGNFRCASFPDDWLKFAEEGYVEDIGNLGNPELEDRPIRAWHELIRGGFNALCTQSYAHIIRRDCVVRYWRGRPIPKPFTNGLGTYPHAYMIGEILFNDPSYYIGKPLVAIFNGAQHWGNIKTRKMVYCNGLPDLINLYKKNGLPRSKISKAKKFHSNQIYILYKEIFSNEKNLLKFQLIANSFKVVFRPYLIKPVLKAFLDSDCCFVGGCFFSFWKLIYKFHKYLFYSCRPARWYRSVCVKK